MTLCEFREAWKNLPSRGWLTLDEALLLAAEANLTRGRIVEVGSYFGRSACLLARLTEVADDCIGDRPRMLVCVDPWGEFDSDVPGDEVHYAFLDNVKFFPNVAVFRQRVEDWEPLPAGFVYLDGDHTYHGTLHQVHKALACEPQTVAAHDVNDSGGGKAVRDAMVATLGPWTERVERLAVWRLR